MAGFGEEAGILRLATRGVAVIGPKLSTIQHAIQRLNFFGPLCRTKAKLYSHDPTFIH